MAEVRVSVLAKVSTIYTFTLPKHRHEEILGGNLEWLLIVIHANDKDNLYTRRQTANTKLPLHPLTFVLGSAYCSNCGKKKEKKKKQCKSTKYKTKAIQMQRRLREGVSYP
jgi:hypothetical protein